MKKRLLALLVLVASVNVTPPSAGAAVLNSFSLTPANSASNAATATTYSLAFSGTSGTAAKCIAVSFESDGGTVPGPSHPTWQYQGGSTTDGSTITLTTPSQNNYGTIAAYEAAIPAEGLHASFTGDIGGGGGADGMTFSLLDPLAYGGYAGSSGGGLGYSGLTGVAVTMDTFQNGADPSSNFMGIATSGSGSNITYASTNTGVPSLRASHAYDVTVVSGHVIVKVDGTQVLDSAVTLPSTVFPAFTAGTGATTDTHAVSGITITYAGGGASGTSAGLPPGMAISSATLTGSTAITSASWGTGTVNADRVSWTYNATQTVSPGTLVINGISHNPTTAGTYYARLATYSNNACTTLIDSSVTAFEITDAMTVNVTINPSLTFNVAGYNSGSCNGATVSATNSTGTAVLLGHTTIASNPVGGQTLTVTTNSGNGFSVYARYSSQLSDGNGHSIADWSGTNSNPTSFPASGTAAFGYTTDHNLSSTGAGTTRFQSNKWAALTATNAEVAYQTVGATSDTTHVCYQVGVAPSTPAATYSTTVIYTAIPIF